MKERATQNKQREGEAALVIDDEDASSVARTRQFVAGHLATHGLSELATDAQLVVSEFLTNALLHVGPPVRVVLQTTTTAARVEVHDRSPLMPVPLRAGEEAMTGRGLRITEALASAWGAFPLNGGKCMWAELEAGAPEAQLVDDWDYDQLVALWLEDQPERQTPAGEERHTVRLGDVPTDLLLTAKSHVDDLVREFTLAASGASSGMTAQVSPILAELIEAVVNRFAEARETIRRQALTARAKGHDHVTLELHLPPRAATAGEEYLRALDEADAYCRAARLLTLETPPQHRVFRRWYVQELIGQLRDATAGAPSAPRETFEQHLLREIDTMAETERRMARAVGLYRFSVQVAATMTPEAVAETALQAGASALGASGGAVLLAATCPALRGPDGDDEARVVARLRDEPAGTELPAVTALRTGEEVWLESREDRDARFPELVGLRSDTVSMAAVPLETGDRRLGALWLGFPAAQLFDEDERRFMHAIAAQTAQAIDRAQLSAAHNDAARRLQRSLLPPELPDVAGLTISAAYHPLTSSLEIGGDLYDVWPCGAGRLAVAMGDVCGHGPEAAAVTALIRHTLRAITLMSSDAVAIVRKLDHALRNALAGSDRFATVAFGFLNLTSEACWLDLATGGHPGPIVLHPDGTTDVVALNGSLLGMLDDPHIALRRIVLAPGDEVVLLTDGVTDARDERGTWFGTDGVTKALNDARSSGKRSADAVSEAVLEHRGGHLHDDVAVLTLRWDGPSRDA